MRLLMLSARLGGFQVILPCPVFLKNHYKLPNMLTNHPLALKICLQILQVFPLFRMLY